MGMFVGRTESAVVDRMTVLSKEIKVLANNIANVNVPGYTAKRVDFAKVLEREQMRLELERTDPRHLPGLRVSPSVEHVPVRDTGRPVELDEELVKITEDSMDYQSMVQLLKSRFDLFESIIKGRAE